MISATGLASVSVLAAPASTAATSTQVGIGVVDRPSAAGQHRAAEQGLGVHKHRRVVVGVDDPRRPGGDATLRDRGIPGGAGRLDVEHGGSACRPGSAPPGPGRRARPARSRRGAAVPGLSPRRPALSAANSSRAAEPVDLHPGGVRAQHRSRVLAGGGPPRLVGVTVLVGRGPEGRPPPGTAGREPGPSPAPWPPGRRRGRPAGRPGRRAGRRLACFASEARLRNISQIMPHPRKCMMPFSADPPAFPAFRRCPGHPGQCLQPSGHGSDRCSAAQRRYPLRGGGDALVGGGEGHPDVPPARRPRRALRGRPGCRPRRPAVRPPTSSRTRGA